MFTEPVTLFRLMPWVVLLVDEATHFTWFIIDYLLTRNRASGEVKLTGFKPFALLCSNPGNIGHAWYSQIYDMEKKQGEHEQVKTVMNPNGKRASVYFLPALLDDNKIGVAADPEYEDRLMQRNAEIARALRWGDWSIFAGQAFPNWTKERVAVPKQKQFEIPAHWAKWRAMDYGFIHPAVMGWFTADPQTKRVYIYRAVAVSNLSDEQQAELMSHRRNDTARTMPALICGQARRRRQAGYRPAWMSSRQRGSS